MVFDDGRSPATECGGFREEGGVGKTGQRKAPQKPLLAERR